MDICKKFFYLTGAVFDISHYRITILTILQTAEIFVTKLTPFIDRQMVKINLGNLFSLPIKDRFLIMTSPIQLTLYNLHHLVVNLIGY